jgi:hypothetical protein
MSCVTFSFFSYWKTKFLFSRVQIEIQVKIAFLFPRRKKRKVIFPVIYKPDVIAGPIALLYHRLKRKKKKNLLLNNGGRRLSHSLVRHRRFFFLNSASDTFISDRFSFQFLIISLVFSFFFRNSSSLLSTVTGLRKFPLKKSWIKRANHFWFRYLRLAFYLFFERDKRLNHRACHS